MVGVVLRLACVILLCTAACQHSPRHDVQQMDEGYADGVGNSVPANLLVEPELRESEDVIDMLVFLVHYLADSCVTDTAHFLSLGNDSAGAWIDPPRVLADRVADAKIELCPVSEAHLAPLPRPLPGQVVFAEQPAISGLVWSLQLREWMPSVRAVLYIAFPRGGATVTLHKSRGGWIIEQWVGLKPWSPNQPFHPAAESGG